MMKLGIANPKSIVMFIWVFDMLTGVGKYRYAGLHGGICVVVMLHNNFLLYMFGLLFFSKTQHDGWDMDIPGQPAALSYLNNKVFLCPLILIVALGSNVYLLRTLLL